MTKILITSADLGKTIDTTGNQVNVKVDNSTITVNEQGQLVANIPAPTVDINVERFALEGTTVKLVETDNTEHSLDLGLVAKVSEQADNKLQKVADGLYVKTEEVQSLGGMKLGYLVID